MFVHVKHMIIPGGHHADHHVMVPLCPVFRIPVPFDPTFHEGAVPIHPIPAGHHHGIIGTRMNMIGVFHPGGAESVGQGKQNMLRIGYGAYEGGVKLLHRLPGRINIGLGLRPGLKIRRGIAHISPGIGIGQGMFFIGILEIGNGQLLIGLGAEHFSVHPIPGIEPVASVHGIVESLIAAVEPGHADELITDQLFRCFPDKTVLGIGGFRRIPHEKIRLGQPFVVQQHASPLGRIDPFEPRSFVIGVSIQEWKDRIISQEHHVVALVSFPFHQPQIGLFKMDSVGADGHAIGLPVFLFAANSPVVHAYFAIHLNHGGSQRIRIPFP